LNIVLNRFILQTEIGPGKDVMESEIADEVDRIDGPDQSIEARDSLTQGDYSNQTGGVLAEFRI
jgi:hypothetical protein